MNEAYPVTCIVYHSRASQLSDRREHAFVNLRSDAGIPAKLNPVMNMLRIEATVIEDCKLEIDLPIAGTPCLHPGRNLLSTRTAGQGRRSTLTR